MFGAKSRTVVKLQCSRFFLCICINTGVKKKTEVIKDELNPVWNEVCILKIIFLPRYDLIL